MLWLLMVLLVVLILRRIYRVHSVLARLSHAVVIHDPGSILSRSRNVLWERCARSAWVRYGQPYRGSRNRVAKRFGRLSFSDEKRSGEGSIDLFYQEIV